MADALHSVARKSQLILMLSQRVRVGTPDNQNYGIGPDLAQKLCQYLCCSPQSAHKSDVSIIAISCKHQSGFQSELERAHPVAVIAG